MHSEIEAQRSRRNEHQFTNAIGFCMLVPGPGAMQLAAYSGSQPHRIRDGLLTGGRLILPGALVMLALAIGYIYFGLIRGEALFIGP